MLGNRLRNLRNKKLMSLIDLGHAIGKSSATISRYENNLVDKFKPELVEKMAAALDTTAAYLLGMTDDSEYLVPFETSQFYKDNGFRTVLVTDDQMAPIIPKGAFVEIREYTPEDELSLGSYYYLKYQDEKFFGLAIKVQMDDICFLPMNSPESSSLAPEWVAIIGRATSMQVFFNESF